MSHLINNNQAFVNGLEKIAYGFALENGLPSAQLKSGVHACLTADGNLDMVNFSFPVVPFSRYILLIRPLSPLSIKREMQVS